MTSLRVEKILSGKSKATVLNDYEVLDIAIEKAELDHEIVSNNYKWFNNILWHNNGIEFIIRKSDGTVIKNSEHRQFSGSMFGPHVSCPSAYSLPPHIDLPLDTILNTLLGFNRFQDDPDNRIQEYLDKIHIIDTGNNDSNIEYFENTGTVIELENKYYWFKNDEANFYLIELPRKVISVQDAEDSLKPNMIRFLKPTDYLRQGDFYFIPVNNEFKEYEKLHYRIGNYNIKENYGNMQQIANIGKRFLKDFPDKFKDPNDVNWSSVISDVLNREEYYTTEYKDKEFQEKIKSIIEYIKTHLNPQREKEELIRYPVYDSNHKADNSANIGQIQFVKGFVYHSNKDHKRTKLENWHLALKNEAISSREVNPNGRGGFD